MSHKFKRYLTADNYRDVFILAYREAEKYLVGRDRAVVTVGPDTMTEEQNKRFHAMVADIASQQKFNNEWHDAKTWKMILISGHAVATGGTEAALATGIEGEVINLRESTSDMSIERSASLIAYVDQWAAEHGVDWSH